MPKKPKCEVGTYIGCNGVAVRLVTGPKKDDPKFHCCLGCRAVLGRQGIKLKDYEPPAEDTHD